MGELILIILVHILHENIRFPFHSSSTFLLVAEKRCRGYYGFNIYRVYGFAYVFRFNSSEIVFVPSLPVFLP